MSKSDWVEETVTGIVADVLDVDPADIAHDAALAALGWDSTNSIEALLRLESTFPISLDLRSLHAARTVGDMVTLVDTLLEPTGTDSR